MALFPLVLGFWIIYARAKVISIKVGDNGSFSPAQVNADLYDVVAFLFLQDVTDSGFYNHSVVQVYGDAPCTPVPGGFASPLSEDYSPEYAIMITDTQPVWFACGATTPGHMHDHCQAGEVGAINPPETGFPQFLSNARAAPHDNAFDAIPANGSYINSGIGVKALTGQLPPVPPATSALSPSATPLSSGRDRGNPGRLTAGPIAGIVLGVLGAVSAALFVIWRFLVRRQRKQEREAWAMSINAVLKRGSEPVKDPVAWKGQGQEKNVI